MLTAIGTVFFLAYFVCHVIVLIHAFKSSLMWGLLCLCLPCPFGIYYLFVKFEHESKGLITIVYLFGGVVGAALHGYNYFEVLGPMLGMGHHPTHHR